MTKKKTYICIGPYCWGKADTIKQAIANAKKHRGSRDTRWQHTVYEAHPDTTVNELGGLRYPIGHKPKRVEFEDRKKPRDGTPGPKSLSSLFKL